MVVSVGYNVLVGTFPRATIDLDPWYVTGFAEGECSFTYSRSTNSIGMYFAIKLTAADRPLLESIQGFFGGIGTIYSVNPRTPAANAGYTRSAALYRVTRVGELLWIVRHFDRYPVRGSKALTYSLWRQMVALKAQHPRKSDHPTLSLLAIRLSESTTRAKLWQP